MLQRHATILRELLTIPTAPFAEHRVINFIRRFCKARKTVTLTEDAAGNLLARVRVGRRRVPRPPCFTAHLDHPGFVATGMRGSGRLAAQWRGGVPPKYFKGTSVRFWVEDRWVKGTIRSTKTVRDIDRLRVDTVTIDVAKPVPAGAIGMWDLPDPRVRGDRIYARGCDDIAGAASLLCSMDALARGRAPCDAYFLFTRAEEVGFVGAIAAAKARTVPNQCFLVCMETSSERINAKMGDGPILRVGDKASVFTPEVTAHCELVAKQLAESDNSFQYQRKLMDGGTCESSAFCTLGYDATGLCLALGNYHNVDLKKGKIGPEYVDLRDFENVVKWFTAIARSPHKFTGSDDTLRKRLDQIERTYKSLLRRSVAKPC